MTITTVDLCCVNFNTQEKLQRLVDTLHNTAFREHYQHWNLYIADNGSTDGSIQYLAQPKPWERGITEICFNKNIGYGAACNQLAAMGKAPIIGLLNADVWLTNNDVEGIIRSFDALPEAAIMGPKQRDEAGRVTHAGIFGTHEAPQHRGWHAEDPDDKLFSDRLPAVTVSGAAYFIRRSAWEELTNCLLNVQWHKANFDITPSGAFGPQAFYYEETQCSYHAFAHNMEVWYDGTTSIGHSWHASHTIGDVADQQWPVSQAMFRSFCQYHNIPHD